MRKLLLAILTIVVIIVVVMVVLLWVVNPNSYRNYIQNQVRAKTGYELKIDGDLRWHVWPQISILTGRVLVTSPQSAKPILTADNMRLDVELWPLFSRQIAINNIMVKSAVININDETLPTTVKTTEPQSAIMGEPVTQTNSMEKHSAKSWQFDLNKLQILDSVITWQRGLNEIINFRDINLDVTKKSENQVDVQLQGNVQRDSHFIQYQFQGIANLANFPAQADLALQELNIRYKSDKMPPLNGVFKGKIHYQNSQNVKQVSISPLELTVNGNTLYAQAQAVFTDKPSYSLAIKADKINLSDFMPMLNKDTGSGSDQGNKPIVIAVQEETNQSNELAFLSMFDADINAQINQLMINNVPIDDLKFSLTNHKGIAQLDSLSSRFLGAKVTASAVANSTTATTHVQGKFNIQQLDLANALQAFKQSDYLTGRVNASGSFMLSSLNLTKMLATVTSQMNLDTSNVRVNNFNLMQLIESAAVLKNRSLSEENRQKIEDYTRLDQATLQINLANGVAKINQLTANSNALNVDGQGSMNVLTKQLDLGLKVHLLPSEMSDKKLLVFLRNRGVPVRLYGSLDRLNYTIDIESLFKDELKEQIKHHLKDELQKLKNKQETKALLQKILGQ